jgi:hypothetical protein
MKSINYIFKSVTLVFVVLIIHSCTKDEPKINFTKELESRTKSQIGDKSIQWLDNFRLDLLENRVSEYSIEDAINGLDILLNLYKTQGVGNFIQYDIVKKDHKLILNQNSKVNTDKLREVFESIYSTNKSHFENSILVNKVLGSIKLSVKDSNSTSITFTSTTVIGSEDPTDTEIPIIYEPCTPKFGPNACFKSGYGDADFSKYITTPYSTSGPLIEGGDCYGNKVGKTSAFEEVQKKFTTKIPKIVNIKNGKWITTYTVKFVNEKCNFIDLGKKIEDFNSFSGCSNDLMNDNSDSNIYPTSIYYDDQLNCSYCIVDNWIKSKIPAGKQMSHLNIFTDKLGGGPGSTKWIVEVCWGEPVLIPIVDPGPHIPGPSPTIKLNSFITNNDPYSNLSQSLTQILN